MEKESGVERGWAMYIKELERDVPALWMEDGGRVVMLDQRLLPEKVELYETKTPDETAQAIKDMVVRGAPAIGVAAAYGMAQGWLNGLPVEKAEKVLRESRPTARDLFNAVEKMAEAWKSGGDVLRAARDYAMDVIDMCRRIGENGSALFRGGEKVLTHCNAGALATVDWGTALAPIRMAHRQKKEVFVWVDETRPWLQGSRLTAWELLQEEIPHSIIADNAAGFFMWRGEVDLVIVGADRVARNGDIANKIGTYEKAVVARENSIPFYVAVPKTTLDPAIASGDAIPIEERAGEEVLSLGGKRIAPSGSTARNPVFDITPSEYITGYITEYGIVKDISRLFS